MQAYRVVLRRKLTPQQGRSTDLSAWPASVSSGQPATAVPSQQGSIGDGLSYAIGLHLPARCAHGRDRDGCRRKGIVAGREGKKHGRKLVRQGLAFLRRAHPTLCSRERRPSWGQSSLLVGNRAPTCSVTCTNNPQLPKGIFGHNTVFLAFSWYFISIKDAIIRALA